MGPGRQTGRVHTHQLTFEGDVVRKRFVSWSDGEADREWAGLTALALHAPGLAPAPIARDVHGGAPVVTMSRLPGIALGSSPLTPKQVQALGVALRRLFAAPADAAAAERAFGPSGMRSVLREWAGESYDLAACDDPPLVRDALDRARVWLARDAPERDRVTDPVLALGDGNLANVMWDGDACRFIDFEEFGISDIAYEVADIVEHASSRLRRLLDVDTLVVNLSLTGAQRERLAEFRRLLSTFWLVMLLPGNRGFTRNPTGSTEDQARHVLALLRG